MSLDNYGWNSHWEKLFIPFRRESLEPARVLISHRDHFTIATASATEVLAEPAGKLRFEGEHWPVTGDWVAVGGNGTRIEAVLERRTAFSRKEPGEYHRAQVLASNIDVAFLVTGLDHDFNLRRLERYVYLTRQSGARPVILLNKADLCDAVDDHVRQCERLTTDVLALSALHDQGLAPLIAQVALGETAVLLGSSGVGKSTIVNRLRGFESQKTAEVREHDSRGRHTTTHRELIRLGFGWMLIDVPGIRELQLWTEDGASSVDDVFDDIAELAPRCRFRDCRHECEPGCAVLAAVAAGEIDTGRWENYQKMRRELAYLEREADPLAAQKYKRWVKQVHQGAKQFYPRK